MTPDGAQHVSPWVATLPAAQLGSTSFHDVAADVVVLGGGIVGMTTGLLLQRAGKQVTVIERDRLGHGVTTQSTVKVTVGQGTIYSQITEKLGQNAAAAYAAANTAGLLTVLELAQDLGIDCDLELAPHVVYAEDEDAAALLRKEAEVVSRLGLVATLTHDVPLPFAVPAALAFERQAQFHPGKYLMGLAQAFVAAGGRVVENACATDVDDGEPCTVTTSAGTVSAESVVVATHYPILNRGGHFARLEQHRSYGIAAVLADDVPAGMTISVSPGGHSTRTLSLAGERLLVVVGASHLVGRVSDTASRWGSLESWAGQQLGATDVRYRWSTQDITSLDHVPYVGPMTPGSEHVFTATGFGGWGMTNGTAAALLLRDLLLGRDNAWAETFDARRIEIASTGKKLVQQNVRVARLWVKGRVSGSQPGRPQDLQPGDAAVLEVDGEQAAVCRDQDGTLHAVSAVCSHLGCTVAWNDGERSWDCPCHGSRFGPDGDVLHSPAVTPLAPVDLPDPS